MYFLFLLILTTHCYLHLNTNQTFTLSPQSYGTIMLTTFKHVRFIDQNYNPGSVEIQFNVIGSTGTPPDIDSSQDVLFDVFLFDSPENELYFCYIYEQIHGIQITNCSLQFAQFCQNCLLNSTLNITSQINGFYTKALQQNYVDSTNTPGSSLCFVNCTAKQISFNTTYITVQDLRNTAEIMIIDNTNFPVNGAPGNTLLNLTYQYQLNVQTKTKKFYIFIKVSPDNTYYHWSLALIIMFIVSTILLTSIYCTLNLKYMKIKSQKQLLRDSFDLGGGKMKEN